MATSYDTYRKQRLKATNEDRIIDINAVQNQAEQQKQLVQDSYKTGIADTQASYENAFRQNEVQRMLNERYLERKAAEMGLTDSGMNRTQLTANQLSYGNQKATLTAQKQKAIDTLAATMRAKMTDIDTAEKADIRAIEKQYDADADTWASNMYKTDLETTNTATEKLKTNALNAYNNLYKALESGSISSADERARLIYDLGATYGDYIDEAQAAMLLQIAGITDEQFDRFVAGTQKGEKTVTYGSTNVIDIARYNQLIKDAKTDEEREQIAATYEIPGGQWDKAAGELMYKIKVEDNNFNWWWGTDTDDRITIYYPDGVTVVEGFKNIKIGDLPKDLRKSISAQINYGPEDKLNPSEPTEKDTGDYFYYSMDLSDVDL